MTLAVRDRVNVSHARSHDRPNQAPRPIRNTFRYIKKTMYGKMLTTFRYKDLHCCRFKSKQQATHTVTRHNMR
jgi:hypothetical protein